LLEENKEQCHSREWNMSAENWIFSSPENQNSKEKNGF